VRHLTVTLVLIGTLGLATSASARDIYFAKQTPEALKAVCDKVTGRFTQDSAGYECGTDCKGKPGTSCTVFCKEGQKCVAQVMGGRRPHSIESALDPSAHHR
jgi:hypothetical protein